MNGYRAERELEQFAAVAEAVIVVLSRSDRKVVAVLCFEGRGVFHYKKVGTGGKGNACRKIVVDSLGEPDVGEIESGSATVEEFDELGRVVAGGVIHDLADDEIFLKILDARRRSAEFHRQGPVTPPSGIVAVPHAGPIGPVRPGRESGRIQGGIEGGQDSAFPSAFNFIGGSSVGRIGNLGNAPLHRSKRG